VLRSHRAELPSRACNALLLCGFPLNPPDKAEGVTTIGDEAFSGYSSLRDAMRSAISAIKILFLSMKR